MHIKGPLDTVSATWVLHACSTFRLVISITLLRITHHLRRTVSQFYELAGKCLRYLRFRTGWVPIPQPCSVCFLCQGFGRRFGLSRHLFLAMPGTDAIVPSTTPSIDREAK
jgi:hypothetical protein